MPPPSASASAARWVADALAGDEALDFSVIRALVGVSPECLACAPEDTRERLALRCLQEVVAVSAEGEVAAAAAGAGGNVLRVDATRSCEEVMLDLIAQVGSPGSLEKDMLPPFSEDIQKFICMKIPTLPENSFELLREVYPETTSMVPPSPVEKSGKENVNDQSNSTVFVNKTDTRDVQKDPMEPVPDLNEPSALYRKCYDGPQENAIGAIGVSVRSAEKRLIIDNRNISIAAEPASATCSDAFFQSNTELMSKKDAVKTTMSQEKSPTINLQPGSCGDKYQNPFQNNDGERPHDGGTNIQSSKDLSHQGSPMLATVAPDLDRSTAALQTYTSEKSHLPEFVAAPDTDMIAGPLGRKTRNSLQHDHCEKASQGLDEGSARIQLVETYPGHNELNLQTTGDVPSVTKHPQADATENSQMFEQKNGDNCNLEVSCADKANPALQDNGNILKNTSCGGQTAIDSPCCNVALHNKSSEVYSLSKKNTGKNMADRSVPNSPQDGNKAGTKRAANKKIMANALVETSNVHCSDDSSTDFAAACLVSLMPSSTQDKDANCSIDGFTEQDLCIKCGKDDGQLLKCSGCSLAAHDSCFGSSVKFDVSFSGQFYCPVCLYTKATEAYQKAKTAYLKARKNLSAFVGTNHSAKQHDEQSTGKQAAATSSKSHWNDCNASKRQSEADSLSHRDEEPGQWRKKQKRNDTSDACLEEVELNECNASKRQDNDQSEAPGQQRKKQRKDDTNDACPEEDQLNGCNTSIRQGNHQSGAHNLSHKANLEPCQQKTNATTDTCTEEVITENASFVLNSGIATNKDSVLHHKRRQVHVAEAREDGNGNSFYEAAHSSQNRCSPVTSQNVTSSNDSGENSKECQNSDEIEATSSNDSGKRSSPPWRNMRHHKATLQKQKQRVVPNNSKKALDMPSPSRRRNYAYPPKRYSNPLAPPGRRSKLNWTEEEVQCLRDTMLKFTRKDGEPIPWVQILEYGRDVFHKTRLPCDLRVKWRNMKKKSGST